MADLNRRMAAAEVYPDDPGVGGVVITGSAQTFSPTGRWIIVSTAGSITGKLLEDAADVVYILPVGQWRMAFKSITSVTTLVGVVLI